MADTSKQELNRCNSDHRSPAESGRLQSEQLLTKDPRALSAWLRESTDRLGLPGASIGLSSDAGDAIAHSGYRSVSRQLPLVADTFLPIGCIAKILTSIALVRLWQDGLVD